MSTRLRSSGIVRSNERIPASTCTTGTPASAAASAPASVELVSPYTSTASGRSCASSGSSAPSIRASCEMLDPPAIPNSRSGRASPSSRKKTAESESSWCWPVCTITSSCRSRSSPETAAALMNCGRLPTTVRIFTEGASGRLTASSVARVRKHTSLPCVLIWGLVCRVGRLGLLGVWAGWGGVCGVLGASRVGFWACRVLFQPHMRGLGTS